MIVAVVARPGAASVGHARTAGAAPCSVLSTKTAIAAAEPMATTRAAVRRECGALDMGPG